MDTLKSIVATISVFIIIIIVGLAIDYLFNLKWFSFIEPKKENVRREIFVNTRSYNEGKVQDLVRYRLEYLRANNEEKKIIENTIRHMFSEYDENRLPEDLRSFLIKIKYGGTE